MIAHNLNEPEKLKHSTEYEFDLVEFENIREHIVHLTLEERIKIPGLIRERAPMIIVGTVLVKFILEKSHWIMFRFSGTEPLLRIYSEAPDLKQLQVNLDWAKDFSQQIDC